ncbi:MAG: hypothetical protein HYV63_12560 [Candidatus Schekmanbacteria bacterium]|nr:hypothetical protein [Candidatus Schekmanbacteria bacterium]
MKNLSVCLLALIPFVVAISCDEVEEVVDDNHDIIVRNNSDGRLWIAIDGSQRGSVDNNGLAETLWDGIGDGTHTLRAYRNESYTDQYCFVETTDLDGREDFYWYILEDDKFEGTKKGDC